MLNAQSHKLNSLFRGALLLVFVLTFNPITANGQGNIAFEDAETYRVLFRGDVSHFSALNLIDHVIIKDQKILFNVKKMHFESVQAAFRQATLPSQDQIDHLLSKTEYVIGMDLTGQPWGEKMPFPDSLRQVVMLRPDWEENRYGVTVRFWSHVSTEDAKNIVREVFGLELDTVRKDANWIDLEMPAASYEIVEEKLLTSDIVVDISSLD